MASYGHEKIDLLKIDIEGAEYRAIRSIIKDNLDVGILCVEYDEANNALDNHYKSRIKDSLSQLIAYGFRIVAVEPKCNYTLVKNELLY